VDRKIPLKDNHMGAIFDDVGELTNGEIMVLRVHHDYSKKR